ncbi:hypothetical protein E3N88_42786 [Mikania micrantha]|uniref:Uncharacterized protein n=1 Tax=Mikania micrantha TaxID=192012 RepID=A0A5N6LGS4_9ASTR|nr:hypothetical protein E3N88_42786 [Mikania micrantha]
MQLGKLNITLETNEFLTMNLQFLFQILQFFCVDFLQLSFWPLISVIVFGPADQDVSDCPKCLSHVREEMKAYMKVKEMSKVENILKSTIQLDDDKDCDEVDISNDDEIEEDIGVLDGEGDGPILGDNDTINLDLY